MLLVDGVSVSRLTGTPAVTAAGTAAGTAGGAMVTGFVCVVEEDAETGAEYSKSKKRVT